jgi:hypothetical protein
VAIDGICGIGFIDELLDELGSNAAGIGGSCFIDELLDELADGIGSNAAGIYGSCFIDELDELANGIGGIAFVGVALTSPRHEITSTGMERASPHKGLLQKNILPIESSDLHLAWLSDEPTFPDSLSHGRALPSKQHIDRRRASAPQADSKQHINRRRASTPQER